MTNVKVQRKDVLSEEEIEDMIKRAQQIENEYFRLRALALISIFYKTGKRRAEVACLEVDDLKIKGKYLSVTFTVVKKRKKNVMSVRREKLLPLNDRFTQYIIDYWMWMRKHHPECHYLFPSIKCVFGGAYVFSRDRHLSGRHVLRIIKMLNPQAWCHLFRETMGAKIVRSDPTIIAPFKVMRRLDLESHTTAFRYMQRYAADIIEEAEF